MICVFMCVCCIPFSATLSLCHILSHTKPYFGVGTSDSILKCLCLIFLRRPGCSAGRTASSRRRLCRFLPCYRRDVFMDVSGLLMAEEMLRFICALAVSRMRPRLPRRAQRRRLSAVKGEQPAETFGGSSSSLRRWRLLALSRRRPLIKDGPMWR